MVIAIDGPAGAGKSTVAKAVAKRLGLFYLDTGALYRALTLKVLEANTDLNDLAAVTKAVALAKVSLGHDSDGGLTVLLDGRDVSQEIREPRITKFVSEVAKVKAVRQIMLGLQRDFVKVGNCVVDGRDIGTVVFPQAEKKFYLDADFSERVKRRYKELKGAGQDVTLEEISLDLANRDRIDSTRECAPLKKAEDAIYIDTTEMSIEEVLNKIYGQITNS